MRPEEEQMLRTILEKARKEANNESKETDN